jgi:hypothetical protein
VSGRIRKFLALSGERRRLLLTAYIRLWSAQRALHHKPMLDIVADLRRQPPGAEPDMVEQAKLNHALNVGWAVRVASRFTPRSSTCLVQALAAQRMLQEANIGGVLLIGAGRDVSEDNPGFAAHAWVKCGESILTGEAGHQQYTVIGAFTW